MLSCAQDFARAVLAPDRVARISPEVAEAAVVMAESGFDIVQIGAMLNDIEMLE